VPDFYLLLVVILFGLAITDLVVGVSNDAVNFLNSAIGSKVAPRRIIMLVASLGIFIGATFSSGMMEVARKGIFVPEYFVFAEIMVIFVAVMLTDIILLDLFNTFGMPTSTTVSIVFELLGAAVAVSLLKIAQAGDSLSTLSTYINSDKALAIISGILLSVAFAFTIGAFIQWLSRLLFSFQYQKRLKYVGAIWGGLAFAILTYFLLIKGLKGASFVSKSQLEWVQTHTWLLIGATFAGWALILQVLISFFKQNILRYIVLFGTFTLAMAFAGNDLVNFIGVPIAGLESYQLWSASGEAADAYYMSVLNQPVRTATYLLLLAGLIMVVTLWFSKKARSVTETEVNLGRQDEGAERFSPNLLSRSLVRMIHGLSKGLSALVPTTLQQQLGQSFAQVPESKDPDRPAFDLVRASVNLTVASALISFATSLKLPLSTTYVSFMVAMGTSLADRAWGRDSAVFRVAGVLNVIGGWFITALVAFTVSACFAWLIFSFGLVAVLSLLALAIFLIVRSFAFHRKKEKEKQAFQKVEKETAPLTAPEVQKSMAEHLVESLETVKLSLRHAFEGLLMEDRKQVRTARRDIRKLQKQNKNLRRNLFAYLRRLQPDQVEASRLYILAYDHEQDLLGSLQFLVDACHDHVANVHNPLSEAQTSQLQKKLEEITQYLELVKTYLQQGRPEDYAALIEMKDQLLLLLGELLRQQSAGYQQEQYNARNSLLYFTLLLEGKDVIAIAARFAKLYRSAKEA
jgi:phosphate/sulfate permease